MEEQPLYLLKDIQNRHQIAFRNKSIHFGQ